MDMMKRPFSKTVLVLLLALALVTGTCWFYAEQILNNIARPHIEKKASQLLHAQVQIGRLNWTDSGCELLALKVNSTGQFQITVPSMTVDFTLASLWKHQVESLIITAPRVEISPLQSTEKGVQAPVEITQKLPVTINQLTVTDGQLLFFVAEQQVQFHDLNFSGSLQRKSDFHLSAFFGTDQDHPLEINGSAELLPQQMLTLRSISWQKQQLLSSPLPIKLTGTDLALGSSSLHLKELDHNNIQELLNTLGQSEILPQQLKFSLSDNRIKFSLQDQALQLELQVKTGQIEWNEFNSAVSDLKLQLNQQSNGWKISGQLRGPAATNIEFNAHLDDSYQLSGQAQLNIPDLDQFKVDLFGSPALRVSGGLRLTTKYSLKDKLFQATAEIHGQPTDQPEADDRFNVGMLSGQGKLSRSGKKDDVSIDVKLASHPFFSASGDFDSLKVALTLNDLPILSKLLNPKQIPKQLEAFNGLEFNGEMSLKATQWKGKFQLMAKQVSLPELTLNNLVGHTKLQYSAGQFKVSETTLDTELMREDESSTQLHIQGKGSYTKRQFALQLKDLSLTELNYISPDEQTGIANAAIKLHGNISGLWPTGSLVVDLSGTTSIQEILVGEFYADLSAYQGNFSLVGTHAPKTGQFNIKSFRFDLPQLGTMTVNGHLSREQIKLQSQLKFSDLSESYGDHIDPLLSETYQALSGLTLEGQLALEAMLFWTPDNWQSHGILQLQGVDAFWQRQQLEMVDGTGSIPFSISSGIVSDFKDSEHEKTGNISFRSLSVGLASLEQGQLQLSASPNRFSFRSPLLLQLAGGRVAIENLNFSWADSKPQGSVNINISAVELERLTTELGLPVMQGSLSAELGTLHYTDRQLTTDGLIAIDVFGGKFQLRNMRYNEPFSSYPTFSSDIDFSGINLLQATRTFDFGEINGLLDGHIQGLELFGRTPSAFSAIVSTRKKGKRNISVKALNNLSILSQGGISSTLSRGLYRFIDFYRYRQIGFKCSLENDIFTLLGTALPGSQRYLVHGGLLPPRIDITTSTPTISFKEMLKRLGRIERTEN